MLLNLLALSDCFYIDISGLTHLLLPSRLFAQYIFIVANSWLLGHPVRCSIQLSFFANISLRCSQAVTLTIASTPAKFPLRQFQTFVLLVDAISWSHRVNIIVQNINVIVQNSLADSLSCTAFSFSHSVLKLIPIFFFF